MKPLAIIPTYMTKAEDFALVQTCLVSLRATVDDQVDVLVVDDGSPEKIYVEALRELAEQLQVEVIAKDENEGFSKTVNIGLIRAQHEGRDAILVNADIEFIDPAWVKLMVNCRSENGEPAAVVGGRLLYPTGLIQHGGIYFSLLHRCFEHIHKFAPHDLPEAMTAKEIPVTGALQFIRKETLDQIGVYDDHFLLGWEDVDYCLRVWKAGLKCVYEPKVVAVHHESVFRGRSNEKIQAWTAASWAYFGRKWGSQSFAEFVPSLLGGPRE